MLMAGSWGGRGEVGLRHHAFSKSDLRRTPNHHCSHLRQDANYAEYQKAMTDFTPYGNEKVDIMSRSGAVVQLLAHRLVSHGRSLYIQEEDALV